MPKQKNIYMRGGLYKSRNQDYMTLELLFTSYYNTLNSSYVPNWPLKIQWNTWLSSERKRWQVWYLDTIEFSTRNLQVDNDDIDLLFNMYRMLSKGLYDESSYTTKDDPNSVINLLNRKNSVIEVIYDPRSDTFVARDDYPDSSCNRWSSVCGYSDFQVVHALAVSEPTAKMEIMKKYGEIIQKGTWNSEKWSKSIADWVYGGMEIELNNYREPDESDGLPFYFMAQAVERENEKIEKAEKEKAEKEVLAELEQQEEAND